MSNVSEILEAAITLPARDRVQLINAIWNTIEPADWVSPSPEWIAVAQQRSQLVDAGVMTVSPWEEVKARARAQAGLDG